MLLKVPVVVLLGAKHTKKCVIVAMQPYRDCSKNIPPSECSDPQVASGSPGM